VGIEFIHPWALTLLPLALLPLLGSGRHALAFSYLPWLPPDPIGRIVRWAWTAIAVLAMAGIVLALAGLSRPQTNVLRTGRGAEVLILMDRSRSMDDRMLPDNWRLIDPMQLRYQVWDHGPVKSQVARDLLSKFVARRTEDRFSLMFFSSNPLSVIPFTQHQEVVQAAIAAGGVGRGLADTDMGRALIAAIDQFQGRPYTGSRIILLVSDGGAQLDQQTRRRIVAGLQRNRIGLYFLYLRSFNGHALDSSEPGSEAVPEVALNRFFQALKTPYRAYQSEVPEDLARAIADVGAQQNLPLEYYEPIPRRNFAKPLLDLSAACCAALLAMSAALLKAWS
jgi:mxaC protein